MISPTFEALVLGIVQGITEFLPVSSDGHLALAQKFFGHEPSLATTVLLHAGTLAATFLILRQRVASMALELGRGLRRPSTLLETPEGHDVLVVLAATIPTGVIGLLLKKRVETWSDSPSVVGCCLLLTAAMLVSTRWAPRGEKLSPSISGAVLLGIAQGSAVLPGLSRSAMTIGTLLWLGIRADRAFELSFLLSLPAITGAILLEAPKAFHERGSGAPLVLGVAVSFVVGIAALLLLKRILAKGQIALFSVYLVPLAIATLAWGYVTP